MGSARSFATHELINSRLAWISPLYFLCSGVEKRRKSSRKVTVLRSPDRAGCRRDNSATLREFDIITIAGASHPSKAEAGHSAVGNLCPAVAVLITRRTIVRIIFCFCALQGSAYTLRRYLCECRSHSHFAITLRAKALIKSLNFR